jgi:hypothetical protein
VLIATNAAMTNMFVIRKPITARASGLQPILTTFGAPGAAMLDRIRACRDDIDALIKEYGDQREERA